MMDTIKIMAISMMVFSLNFCTFAFLFLIFEDGFGELALDGQADALCGFPAQQVIGCDFENVT